jgi:hypothetical protein
MQSRIPALNNNNNAYNAFRKQELLETRELLMDRVGKDLPKTYYQRGGRLRRYLWRWKKIGGFPCVGYGITANYTDMHKAFDYWKTHKKWSEYRGTPKMQAEYEKIVEDWVKTGTIEKCSYEKLI